LNRKTGRGLQLWAALAFSGARLLRQATETFVAIERRVVYGVEALPVIANAMEQSDLIFLVAGVGFEPTTFGL
jgi:hypothetical protein